MIAQPRLYEGIKDSAHSIHSGLESLACNSTVKPCFPLTIETDTPSEEMETLQTETKASSSGGMYCTVIAIHCIPTVEPMYSATLFVMSHPAYQHQASQECIGSLSETLHGQKNENDDAPTKKAQQDKDNILRL